MEKITLENNNPEAWVCICGNKPSGAGFYPCDKNGNEVEPTPKDWHTDCYVCSDCGRIINMNTLEVVGQNKDFKRLE